MTQRIHNRKELKEIRQKLRNNMTKQEIILWLQLKGSQLQGKKFRRQHIVNNFILDFYCPEERIGIEIDGGGHYSEEFLKKDKKRDDYIRSMNIKILRFTNRDIEENIDGVLETIIANFNHPLPPP